MRTVRPVARALPREAGARQAQAHHGIADALLAGIPDALPVEVGTLAGDGVEELVAKGVEDDPEARLATDDEGDADGEEGQAIGVVDGAVERVDDPHPVGRLAGDARFLGQEAIGGEGRPDHLEDGRLAQVVDLGDDVLLRLVDDALEPFVALHVDGAGSPGGRGGHLELTGKVIGHPSMLAQQCRRAGAGASARAPTGR